MKDWKLQHAVLMCIIMYTYVTILHRLGALYKFVAEQLNSVLFSITLEQIDFRFSYFRMVIKTGFHIIPNFTLTKSIYFTPLDFITKTYMQVY